VDGKERSIRGQKILDKIENLGKPVIAAVNGFALGGGCELAMACHVRIASEGARLGTPEVKLGIMCGYAGTQRLPRLVGKGRALEILLTGEMVDAQEALRIGLVNRVVPKESLLTEAEALLRKMLANGPVSLRFTIEAVGAGLEMPLREAQFLEATLFGLICTTEDMKEGTKAFLEKRPAKFQGK
jgi:enoyl-CoA hydratase